MNHEVYKNVGQDKPTKDVVEVYDSMCGTYVTPKKPEPGKPTTIDPSPFGSLKK